MKPVGFEGWNTVFAKNQPQYRDLPAHRGNAGIVTSCWALTFRERVKIMFTGRVWLQVLTFGEPLQPQLPSVDKPVL